MAPAQRTIEPAGWERPRGYANGVLAEGRLLFIAGQIGWDPARTAAPLPERLSDQFDRALSNVLEVLRAAGGEPTQLTRMTVYVTDKHEYIAQAKEIGERWRARLGKHYPAMTLVQVAALLEESAKVEIEATAVL